MNLLRTNQHRLLQAIVVVSWGLQLFSYCLSYVQATSDPAVAKLFDYDGYNAIINSNLANFYYLPLGLSLIASVGLFFLQNWARFLFLILWLYGWIATLLFGVRISLPITGFIGMTITTLDGIILALIFLTPMADSFKRK